MKIIARCIVLLLFTTMMAGCDRDHTKEYNAIDWDDVAGYQTFIREYPNSKHVPDARERLEVAIEYQEQQRLREEQEQREYEARLLREQKEREIREKYSNNSLSTGAQPYRSIYGSNQSFHGSPHSSITVRASEAQDVVVIVRRGDQNGRVAGHCYIKAGGQYTIQVANGHRYQTFFYLGKGWYPDKEMKNGVVGGFIRNEAFTKDPDPSFLSNMSLEYRLIATENGNFSVEPSSEDEVF